MRLLNTCYGNKYSLIWREKNEKTYWIDIICSNVACIFLFDYKNINS